MLQVTYRKKGLRLSHVWFATKEQLANEQYKNIKASLYYLHGVPFDFSELEKSRGRKQYSLIKELDLSEEELFLSMGKHLRQYIKRSKKENLVRIDILDSDYLIKHPEILTHCKTIYEKMYSDKNMKVCFNAPLMNAYIQAGAMVIGIASIEEKYVGFSAVIIDNENARLWLAAFDFRNDSLDSQALSRGHQNLDWELILWCKSRGIKYYDFGGISDYENPNGIDKFKLAFEKNNVVQYQNYIVSGSLFGRIALGTIVH